MRRPYWHALCKSSALGGPRLRSAFEQWLILDSNELASLPENIQQLTSLERLSACKNSLSTLPDGVGVLQRLKVCHISGNKLSSLPASLGNCSALEELDLSGNYIQVWHVSH